MKGLNLLVSMSLVAALAGCTQSNNKKNEDTPQDKEVIRANKYMPLDEIVEAGEQLMGPTTLHLADRAFTLALEKDPQNLKAQFYKAFLARTMVMRGVLERIRPLVKSRGEEAYRSYLKQVNNLPESPMKSFLLDSHTGRPYIKDYDSALDFIAEYRDGVNEFRKFVSRYQDGRLDELNLYMNPHLFKEKIEENTRRNCQVTSESVRANSQDRQSERLEVVCDAREVALVKVNVADLILMKQFAAGEVLLYSLYTAYSIKGVEILESMSHLSAQERQKQLEALPEFGRLKSNHTLKLIKSMGADYTAAARWVLRSQRELCPKGQSDENNRRGYLIEQGVCVTDLSNAESGLAMIDKILGGVISNVVVKDQSGHDYVTDINYITFFENPVTDLRQLAPATWNQCDRAATLRDKTFNGVFPRGDAERVMLETCP